MNFITDEEINLNEEDSLQTKKYVNTLKEMIECSDSKYTIGLFGEWGTGKSSIVKTVQEELESEKPKDIKFIVYDAWKYSGDSFRRMFIRTLSDKLGFQLSDEIDNFYYDKTEEIEEKAFDWKTIFKNIGIFLGLSLLIYLLIYIVLRDTLSNTENIGIIAIIPIIISSISIFLNNAYKTQKKVVQYNKFFAPEQFENLTNQLLSKSLKDYPIFERFSEYIKGNNHIKNLKKVVIVIDNIDRCDSATSYQLLTNIKNFLANKEGVIFLIPIDDEALKRHLSIEDEFKSKEADEFLRKFFNVSLKIKYFQPTDLFQFTNDLNTKYNLKLNPSTIDIISKEYATNPRRIIQMLNNLITELNLISNKLSKEFVSENETLITILLIIREEWVSLYKEIVNKPHSLKEKILGDDTFSIEEMKFLKNSKTIIEKSQILSIEKIVLNIDNNSLMTQEVISFLESEDYDSIKSSIEENTTTYDKVFDYLCEELKKEVERNTFDTSVVNVFSNIINLNIIQSASETHLIRIKTIIEDKEILNKIFQNIEEKDFNTLFNFVIHNKNTSLYFLYTYFKSEFNSLWSQDIESEEFSNIIKNKSEIIKYGFVDFINNILPSNIDKTFKNIFQNYYLYNNANDSLLLSEMNIDIEMLKAFDYDNITSYLIKKLDFSFTSEVNINDYINDDYKELKYIMDTSLVSLKEIEGIFDKFSFEFTSIQFTQNAEQVKISLTEIINNFLEDITKSIFNLKSYKYESSSVISFISNLVSNKPFYYNNTNRYSDNFLYESEVRRDQSYQKTLLSFYIELFSTSLNFTDVVSNIYNLISKYPSLKNDFYEELLTLNEEKNISFVRIFKNKIYEDTDYSNDLLLSLLTELFNDKERDDESVSTKIKDILETILREEDNQKQNDFIEKILVIPELKELVTNEIIKFDIDDIKQFNQSLQRLTYDFLSNEDKIFDIEQEMLIDMIRVNEELYKKDILRVIKSNLPKITKLPIVFDLIDNLSTLTSEEKNEIAKELSQHSNHKKLKDKVNEYCQKLKV